MKELILNNFIYEYDEVHCKWDKNKTNNLTYKDFDKKYIGLSDGATLVMIGANPHPERLNASGEYEPVIAKAIYFGEDHDYRAYFVDEKDVNIGEHYKEVARFDAYLKIVDDKEVVRNLVADHFIIYRAGELGCIIQGYNDK